MFLGWKWIALSCPESGDKGVVSTTPDLFIRGRLRVSSTDQWWPCFPTKSPGNLSPSVLAFLLYVDISQWLGSRGAKLKVGCWVSKIKGGLNGAGHLTLSDGVGLKAWKLYLIGGVTALLRQSTGK